MGEEFEQNSSILNYNNDLMRKVAFILAADLSFIRGIPCVAVNVTNVLQDE